jgi:hypothetical protein
VLRHWVRGGDLESLFERAALEQVEAGNRFIRLGHGTFCDLEFIVTATDRLRLRDGFEDMADEPNSTAGQICPTPQPRSGARLCPQEIAGDPVLHTQRA